MKKITGAIALLLAMLMLASCGGIQQVAQEDPEKEIRASISSFLDAVFELDTDKAKLYAANDKVVDEINDELNLDDALDSAMAGFDGIASEMFPENKVRGYLEDIIKKIFKTVTYEITDVKVEGDKATANIKINVPDMDSLDMSSVDMESIMADVMGFDMSDPQAMIQEFLSRTNMSITDIASKYSADQSALISDIFDAFSPEFDKMFEAIGDKAASLANSTKKTEYEGTVTLEKGSDNTWKISEMD